MTLNGTIFMTKMSSTCQCRRYFPYSSLLVHDIIVITRRLMATVIETVQSIRQQNRSPYNAVQIYFYKKYNFRSLFWAPAIFITYSLTYIFCSVIWICMKSTTQLVWYLRSPPVQYGRRQRIGSTVVAIVFNGISIDPAHITSDKKFSDKPVNL